MGSGQVYKLKRVSPNVWGLFGNETEAGSLIFRNAQGSLAEAKTGNETLMLSRNSSFRKDLQVRKNDEPVGTFLSDILSRGALSLNGHTYRWRPRNIAWTEWAFETTHGFPVVEIRLATMSSLGGSARVLGNIEEKEARLLSLLGWYLLMLSHQDFDVHLRHVAGNLWKSTSRA